jgi:hypothetical protein
VLVEQGFRGMLCKTEVLELVVNSVDELLDLEKLLL